MERKDYCEPIKTYEESLQYSTIRYTPLKYHNFPENSYSCVNERYDCHFEGNELQPRKVYPRNNVPKTLVCHDMKGGYLEDKYIYGCATGNGYTFYRWSNIDVFVYFSHHFITIPPIGWIDLAHKNNVKILGTVITEFEDGILKCEQIFKSDESWRNFADALVNICIIYKFDGWLLNIENEINDTEPLLKFVKYLHAELKNISPHFTLIWYDSVTKFGKLKWQNELNDLNKCYFDSCDGIFLNYTWNETNLKNSAENAEGRFLDVFVGVDVFGRNFFAGGGFNCDQAAELIRKMGLSMAIFAQGWTHETLSPKTLDNFYEIYLHRDNAFWLKMYPYLYTKPIEKCFSTTFYTGSDKFNYNLSLQEKLLNVPIHSGPIYFSDQCNKFCNCIQIYTHGCKPNRFSYLLTCKSNETGPYIHRLFSCNIFVQSEINIKIVTKEGRKENLFSFHLLLEDLQNQMHNFKLNEFRNPAKIPENFEGIFKDWKIKEFILNVKDMKLKEIGISLDDKNLLVGGFSIET